MTTINLHASEALQFNPDEPILRIQPSTSRSALGLRELWQYRELLYLLTWRDVTVRYKQTAIGVAWAVIQPLLTMVVFSLFFGKLGKIPSNGLPYPIFAFCALVPWTFFANGLTQSSNSLVQSANLIKKVYFPRLAIPISTIFAGVVDFLVAFAVLVVMMVYYGLAPTPQIWALPFLLLLALITSLGVGLWLATLNVKYRDVRYIVPFLVQFWLFATPIAYPSAMIPEPWKTLYGLNPMAGVVAGFRWALLGVDTAPGFMIVVSAAAAIAILVSGAYYFRRVEREFADIV